VRLADLLRELPEVPSQVVGATDVEIRSLCADSRTVKPGALFFALPGLRTHGRQFVDEAVSRGAVAVAASEAVDVPAGTSLVVVPAIARAMARMAAAFYGYPSRRLVLVGVTGTNGKTTVTWLLESIWRAAGRRPGVIGTVAYRIGEREWPAPLTTPQAIELQGLLAEMVEAGADSVAMEVSSHALALERTAACEWDAAVFTNLTRDHLDFHRDLESYFAAKRRLFVEGLRESSKADRFAVVHRDDAFGRRLLEEIRERVVTFGRSPQADVRPLVVERSLRGWTGEISLGGSSLGFASTLVGDAHLDNVLAAAAVAWAQGIPPEAISRGIEACRGVPGRMERIDGEAPFAVFVDYAHTPDALERSVKALRDLAEGRLIVVFGCGGDRDRGKRPAMGEIAGRLADVVILTSDNPRTEDPQRILHEIESGVIEAGLERLAEPDLAHAGAAGYVVLEDRRRAIRLAIRSARPQDVVLIAGKGHEPYQIVGTEKLPFDDREEARRWLAEVSR
jgi:UDP-N-acetylmuramoyl-L-alanyl-D-glutamate--2,6-diaminopimelate ligase